MVVLLLDVMFPDDSQKDLVEGCLGNGVVFEPQRFLLGFEDCEQGAYAAVRCGRGYSGGRVGGLNIVIGVGGRREGSFG